MPAFLATPLIKYGLIALVIGALFGLWRWERHDRMVAEERQAVAERQAAISAQDAERWQDAWTVATARVTELGATLDQQSAAIQSGRAKEAELRKSLDSARQQNDRLAEEVDAARREIDEEVRTAPGDIREVGPIVLKRAGALFQ